MKRAWPVAVRLAVAAGLTAYVLWKSDPSAALSALRRVEWRYLAAAIGLVLIDRALMAYRWLVLLQPLPSAAGLPYRSVLRVFFVSTFVGTFLPASVGGDAVRSVALARHAVPLTDVVTSVLLDRVFGILAILLVAAVAVAAAPAGLPAWMPPATIAGAVGAALGIALMLLSAKAQALAQAVANRLPPGRVRQTATDLLRAVRTYRTAPAALWNVLAGSVGVQLLRIWQAWLLGLSLGISAGPIPYLVYVPIILLVMLLPITISGLGTSQAAFVYLFGLSGVAEWDAFALSVLFVALGIVGNLPGAALYVSGGLRGSRDPRDRIIRSGG